MDPLPGQHAFDSVRSLVLSDPVYPVLPRPNEESASQPLQREPRKQSGVSAHPVGAPPHPPEDAQ